MSRPKGSKNKGTVGTSGSSSGPSHSITPENQNCIFIENLFEVVERVKVDMEEKKINPGVVHEEEAGIVFKDGEPYRIIGNEYVKNDEALVILQTRKVVREYLKLLELKDKLKRGLN